MILRAWLALVATLSLTLAAQAQDLGGFHTNVQLAAGRLLVETQGLAGVIERLPLAVRRELLPRAIAVIRQVDSFSRLTTGKPSVNQMRQAFDIIDREEKDLIFAARRFSTANVPLQLATVNVSSALTQIDFLLNPGVGNGGVANNRDIARRLARQIEGQARECQVFATRELPAIPATSNYLRLLTALEAAASRLAWTISLNPNDVPARQQFATLAAVWRDVFIASQTVPLAPGSTLRVHLIQIDVGFRNLARIFDGVVDPRPIFPILPPFRDQSLIALGAGEGMTPTVRLFTNRTGETPIDFMPYEAGFQGGVRVAVGDVTGDGVVDVVTAPGPGGPPLVRVFDGRDLTLIHEFLAYAPNFRGGVFVALGDINRNGRQEIITGADAGATPLVRIIDGRNGRVLREFLAYEPRFRGGVRVAVGDVTGDGTLNIVTGPGAGMAPLVRIFDPRNGRPLGEFNAYDPRMNGGIWVTAADFNRNGTAEIVTGADRGGPHIRIFRGLRGDLVSDFFAYDQTFLGGARVAIQDVNRDGWLDIVTVPGPGAPVLVRIFDGRRKFAPMNEFAGFPPAFRGGGFVSTR